MFTAAASQALSAARVLARTDSLGTHHLLLALFDAEGSLAAKVLDSTGVGCSTLRSLVDIGTGRFCYGPR